MNIYIGGIALIHSLSQFNAPPQSSYPLSLLLPIPVQLWKNFLHSDMETPYQMSCFDSKKLNTWSGSLDPFFYSFKPYDAEKSTSTFEMLYSPGCRREKQLLTKRCFTKNIHRSHMKSRWIFMLPNVMFTRWALKAEATA
jgi:hypothetical protein